MGSSGTGHFSDYHSSSSNQSDSSRGGGSSGEDRCDQGFETELEEMERCSYYLQHRSLPESETHVKVRMQGRVGVETTSGELIGYLPTRYNYLAGCIREGRSYAGRIISASNTPILYVLVEIHPINP